MDTNISEELDNIFAFAIVLELLRAEKPDTDEFEAKMIFKACPHNPWNAPKIRSLVNHLRVLDNKEDRPSGATHYSPTGGYLHLFDVPGYPIGWFTLKGGTEWVLIDDTEWERAGVYLASRLPPI